MKHSIPLLYPLPDIFGSCIDVQDTINCEMFVELIEPSSKKTTNEPHGDEDQNVLYVP